MKLFTTCCIICLLILSCNSPSKKSTPGSEPYRTTLKLNWIYSGSFAPEAAAVNRFAKANNLELTLEEGGQGKDPLKLVRDGQFGAAAADEILRANDKGANFVIIGVINDNSPACFISLKQSNIKTPKDFEGKTVGLLPFGSTGIIYKILLKKAGVDQSKIKEISVYPDLKVFVAGNTHQIQPGFVYDETVSLDEQKIAYDVIEPKNYGVVFKGPCYFTTKRTILENPGLVQAFINTMAQGMDNAINDPNSAIAELKAISSMIKEDRELKVWQRGLSYYRGLNNQPLNSDTASWKTMIAELLAFKEIKTEPSLANTIDLSFVHKYYSDK